MRQLRQWPPDLHQSHPTQDKCWCWQVMEGAARPTAMLTCRHPTQVGLPWAYASAQSSVGLGCSFPPPHLFSHRANSSSHPSQATPDYLSSVAVTYRGWHHGDHHRACGRFAGTLLAETGQCFLERMGRDRPFPLGRSCPHCLSATTTRVLGALQKITRPQRNWR